MPWYTDAAIMLWASAIEIQHDPLPYCQVGAEKDHCHQDIQLLVSKPTVPQVWPGSGKLSVPMDWHIWDFMQARRGT